MFRLLTTSYPPRVSNLYTPLFTMAIVKSHILKGKNGKFLCRLNWNIFKIGGQNEIFKSTKVRYFFTFGDQTGNLTSLGVVL